VNLELIEALKQLEREKNIDSSTILEALEQALATAYKKNYPGEEEIRAVINPENGELKVYAVQTRDDEEETLIEKPVNTSQFGRIAAQTAKQVITQRIREFEREQMYEEYRGREGDIVTGIVQQSDQRYTLVNLGRVEALLPITEQVSGERYEHGTRLKAYIVEVRRTSKEPQIVVSRSHPGLLRRLFELEVPEIYDGLVEIVSVAREAGYRSKISVASSDKNVDPVGACVGPKGSRVRMVVMELRGEKIDIVQYSEDPAEYVANSLSPAKVKEVKVNEDEHSALVIVPDNQLSLAIGKEGQNARLAAKLTGWRIDIKSEMQVAQEALTPKEDVSKEKAEIQQCKAIKSNGQRCSNPAKPGSQYCGIAAHQKQAEEEIA
jgi:N utilization substance protein A